MKLSKIYSNRNAAFGPIDLNDGLSTVLAEIRLPQNLQRDTHNLGKSVLARLIDFCLLMKKSQEFFLFKHEEMFRDFVFFIEIQVSEDAYLTIRRSVGNSSKVTLKQHSAGRQDFRQLGDDQWDHFEIPFEKGKTLVDGLLNLTGLAPWDYRYALGYLLRSQDDYSDVFQLEKVKRSPHKYWKPYLSHILGFDSQLISDRYEVEDEIDDKTKESNVIKSQLGGDVVDPSKVDGLLLLKKADADKKAKLLDAFDFRERDTEVTEDLVETLNEQIAQLNSERYFHQENRKRISRSIDEGKMSFDADQARQLFKEAGVMFDGQLKADFDQLIDFNKAITKERGQYLRQERRDIDKRLEAIKSELSDLGKQRSDALAVLSETDEVRKYKELSSELVVLRADIESLERQKEGIEKLQELDSEVNDLKENSDQLKSDIGEDVKLKHDDKSSRFSQIRLFFSDIVESVIGQKALLSVQQNNEGNLEFSADILDASGNQTSADDGYTYRKLLCIAFDLAVLRASMDIQFPRFVYHDGVFESLDDRKKVNLLQVIRDYSDLGIQQIITVIDSDLPHVEDDEEPVFRNEEIVLRLHDEGPEGRLFRMPSW